LAIHLAKHATRALFIWGQEDRVDPPLRAAIAIAERLPNARLVLLPDAGHLPWLDDVEECARLITDFLA
jgi:pimeloyl-ACP methyl ester carboxylesterase